MAVVTGCLLQVWSAETPATIPPKILRSQSGQFVVAHATAQTPINATRPTPDTVDLVDLEVGTLVFTCERVRRALLTELQQNDVWWGRVYVVINPQLADNSPAVIGARYFTQGWQYRVELPPRIEPQKLVRGLTQVLLMEFANRTRPTRSAEIPLWLSEGLTQHLLHSALVDLVVRPPQAGNEPLPTRRTIWQQIRVDPLASSRQRLQTHAALSFGRMAEITGESLAPETWKTFQASSHVFLVHLLQIPGGRVSLATMLTQLPHHLNWQTVFIPSFQPLFTRMLDVEKWWSVVLVSFTGQDPMSTWQMETALEKLADTLRAPVLVSQDQQALPHRQRVTAQQIISQWNITSQRMLLQGMINQLLALRFKMPYSAKELTEAYYQTLNGYLQKRTQVGRARSLPGLPSTAADLLVRETVAQLDALDQRRADLGRGDLPSAEPTTLKAPTRGKVASATNAPQASVPPPP